MPTKQTSQLKLEVPSNTQEPGVGALMASAQTALLTGSAQSREVQAITTKLHTQLALQAGVAIKAAHGVRLMHTTSQQTLEWFDQFVEFDRTIPEKKRSDEDQADLEVLCHAVRQAHANSLLAMWMSIQHGMGPFSYSIPEVIDYTTTEFTPEEQLIQTMEKFRTLPKFQFLVRPALEEGNIGTGLKRVSIARFDQGQYPDEKQIAEVRGYLRQKCGIPLAEILANIESRKKADPESEQRKQVRQKRMKSAPHLAILNDEEDATDATASHHLSTVTENTLPATDLTGAGNSTAQSRGQDDDFWR